MLDFPYSNFFQPTFRWQNWKIKREGNGEGGKGKEEKDWSVYKLFKNTWRNSRLVYFNPDKRLVYFDHTTRGFAPCECKQWIRSRELWEIYDFCWRSLCLACNLENRLLGVYHFHFDGGIIYTFYIVLPQKRSRKENFISRNEDRNERIEIKFLVIVRITAPAVFIGKKRKRKQTNFASKRSLVYKWNRGWSRLPFEMSANGLWSKCHVCVE